MKRNQFILITTLVAIIFTLLFYKNNLGINLLIFEWLLIPLIIYLNKPLTPNLLSRTLIASLFISSIMVVIINTPWTIFINLSLLLTTSSVLSFRDYRCFAYCSIDTFARIFTTHFANQNFIDQAKNRSKLSTILLKIFLFGIVPLISIIVFFLIYVGASSKFADSMNPFFKFLNKIYQELNIILILVFYSE